MQSKTIVKTVTATRVAVGVALIAGSLAIANAALPFIKGSTRLVVAAPAGGATVSGSVPILVTATAKVTGTRFTFQKTDASAPAQGFYGRSTDGTTWTGTWDTTRVPDGQYRFYASTSMRDVDIGTSVSGTSRSTVVNSEPVIVTIANQANLPVVTMTSPAMDAVLGGVIKLSAAISSPVRSFRFIGRNKADPTNEISIPARSADGRAWTAEWNTANLADGKYSMYATALVGVYTSSGPQAEFTLSQASVIKILSSRVVAGVANGKSDETKRNISVTFDKPAENVEVVLRVAGTEVSRTKYAHALTKGQKVFSVEVSGLKFDTTYDYVVSGTALGASTTASANGKFKTAPAPVIKINSTQVVPVTVAGKRDETKRNVVITFDKPATNVEVVLTKDGVNTVFKYTKTLTSGQRAFSIPLEGLALGATYTYSVRGALLAYPSSSIATDGTFTTMAAPGSTSTTTPMPATGPKGKPTVSVVQLPSTILRDGVMVLSRVTIWADATSDIALSRIGYQVTKSAGLAITSPGLRLVGEGSNLDAKATLYTCEKGQVTCSILFDLTNEQLIAAGSGKKFDLRATVTGSMGGDTTQTLVMGGGNTFLWSDMSAVPHTATSADWYDAVTARGLPTEKQILVNDSPSAALSPATLSVTLAPEDAENSAGRITGGASGVVLAKFKLSASGEELKVSKMYFGVVESAPINTLSLYDGTVLVGGPVAVGTYGADFAGMNFVVGKDSSKILTVKASLNTVGQAAPSGTRVFVAFTDNPGTFEARGTASGSTAFITKNTGSGMVQGPYKYFHKSKPVVSATSLPSTSLYNGPVVLSRVTISADNAGDVAVKRITFNVSPTQGMTIDAPTLTQVGQGSSGYAAETSLRTCIGGTYCSFTLDLHQEIVIAAGASKTFEFRANVTGATSGSSVSTSVGVGDIFHWSDISAVPHSMTTPDWFAGDMVKALPTEPQTLYRN